MQSKQGSDGLTDKQRAFVREIRKDPTASHAEIVRRAGYRSGKNPAERARVLLLDPRVTAALYGGSPASALRAIIASPVAPDSAKRRATRKLDKAVLDALSGIRFEDGVLVTSRWKAALAIARFMAGAPPARRPRGRPPGSRFTPDQLRDRRNARASAKRRRRAKG